MTTRHRLDSQAASRARRRARKTAAYIAEHGPALCQCGCGNGVNFDQEGRPRMYIIGHNPYHLRVRHRPPKVEMIPIEAFRKALRSLKESKGWTWDQTADMGGISHGHIRMLMYGRHKLNVRKDWATEFFHSMRRNEVERRVEVDRLERQMEKQWGVR